MNENNFFLTVYELKDKFRYLIRQDAKKKRILRELSACIVEKFNDFHIVCAEFDKKLRQSFRPVDIFYTPVKKGDQLANCFLSRRVVRDRKAVRLNILPHGSVILAQIITSARIGMTLILKTV